MSDTMQTKRSQQQQSSKFAEGRLKLSTSCVECHRRKQRCDRKQPCGHCSRRYPQPPCIYRNLRQVGSLKDLPEAQTLPTGLPILDYVNPIDQSTRFIGYESRPDSSGPLSFPAELSVDEHAIDPTLDFAGGESNEEQRNSWTWRITPDIERDFIHYEPDPEPPSISVDTLEKFTSEDYQQLLTTMVSQISSAVLDSSVHRDSGILENSRSGKNKSPQLVQESSGKAEGTIQIARSVNPFQSHHAAIPGPSHFSISSVEPLHYLGITPTVQSAELLQAFLKLITKYVVSIDGNPSPNYYNDYWVSWSVKSPLLVNLGIFTAACYQAETQKLPPGTSPVVLRYKLESIELLNKMLGDIATATSSEAIAGVVYLLTNEWYWSNPDVVQRHLRGLREMVRLRGGLENLGMSGFLRKLILLTDYNISCSYDIEPSFLHNISGRPYHPVEFANPFVTAQRTFVTSVEELHICKETGMILDDMRFLILAVATGVNRSLSDQEMAELTASSWIRDRIESLPDGSAAGDPLATDFIYKSCRIAAIIYCKAIVERSSLSKVCTLQDLNLLWVNMWQIKLSRWKQIPGIFLFVILSALSAAEKTPHGRFLKTMFKTTAAYIANDHWDLVDAVLMGFVKLQRWLRTGEGGIGGPASQILDRIEFLHLYGR